MPGIADDSHVVVTAARWGPEQLAGVLGPTLNPIGKAFVRNDPSGQQTDACRLVNGRGAVDDFELAEHVRDVGLDGFA